MAHSSCDAGGKIFLDKVVIGHYLPSDRFKTSGDITVCGSRSHPMRPATGSDCRHIQNFPRESGASDMTTSHRVVWIRVISAIAIAFGLLTIKEGGAVLFFDGAGREAAGNYVPFVLWFNFLA
ncbi:MAG: hypothetical protein ABIY56_10000, partial [Dokdonella sp.]